MAGNVAPLTLGDVVTLQRGTTYKSALLGQPGPILLGLASIQRNGGFRDDNLKTYGGDSPERLTLRPGDIYVSLKDVTQSADLLGAIARVPPHIPIGRVTQDTVRLTFIRKDVPSRYLYWLLRTPAYREYCRAHAIGTTNLSIAREDFLAFPVPQPKEREFTLVETLDALDDKIQLNRRMNATLEAIAGALFHNWFVDFKSVHSKFDSCATAPYSATTDRSPGLIQDSEAEYIPKGWNHKQVHDVVEGVYDGPHATPKESDTGPVFLGIKNLTGSALDLSDVRHIAESDWLKWTKRITPQRNDIVFSYEATLDSSLSSPPTCAVALGVDWR